MKLIAQGEGVDHTVELDAKKGLIIGSAERCPMKRCEAALTACVGNGIQSIVIAEIRRFTYEEPGTNELKRQKKLEKKRKLLEC